MRELTRDEILSAEDLKTELVAVPEWGEDACVRVRAFSLEARTQYLAPLAGLQGDERRAASESMNTERLVAASLVDASGNLLFTVADIPALRRKNPDALDRIVVAASRVNGIGAAAAEDAAKN